MAMNRSKNDDLKRQAELDRAERERLEQDGMSMREALELIDDAIRYWEQHRPINTVKVDPARLRIRDTDATDETGSARIKGTHDSA